MRYIEELDEQTITELKKIVEENILLLKTIMTREKGAYIV